MLIHPGFALSKKHRVENKPSVRPDMSVELRPNWNGVVGERYGELFYMRIGRLSFRQRWIDREVSPSLTAVVVLLIALGGFMLGFVLGRLEGGFFSFLWSLGVGGLGSGIGKEGDAVSMPVAISVPVSVLGSELYGSSSVWWEYQWSV